MKLEPTKIGGSPRTFAELMTLEQLDKNLFRSTVGSSGESPVKYKGGIRKRAYGGHVYAQAVWACAQTVEEGFFVHSVNGYFVNSGWSDIPFVYKIQEIKNGRSYAVRRVDLTQIDTDGMCFSCTCSFKKPDASPFDIQDPVGPEEKYKSFLAGWKPQHSPRLEFKDFVSLIQSKTRGYTESLPTIKIGILPMDDYNKARPALDRRHLIHYTVDGALPSVKSSPNLHACNHLYMSDQQSLVILAKHFDVQSRIAAMSSLSTTVIFHTGPEYFAMHDEAGNEKWFCQEVWAGRLADGRGAHHSRIWDDSGRHIATTCQDGLLRVRDGGDDQTASSKKGSARDAKI